MNRASLDCPVALVIHRIIHEDRAGQSSATTPHYGEIVTMDHEGEAVIATDEAILRCPAGALHPVDEAMAAPWDRKHQVAPDFIAAQELVRFIPAQTVAFTLRWLDAAETRALLRDGLIE